MKEYEICSYQIGKPSPKYEAPIINYRVYMQDKDNIFIQMRKRDYEILNKYAYMGQIQQEEIDRLNKDIKILQNMLIESQALCDEYIEKYNNLKALKEDNK